MSRVTPWVAAIGLASMMQAALAQERVYRCGASYSNEPCASGSAVDVDDRRSAPQVAEARTVAQRDARLADALTRQREQAEQAAARQGPVMIGTPIRVAHDGAACQPGAGCARADHPRRKRDKSDRVTLYRAVDAR